MVDLLITTISRARPLALLKAACAFSIACLLSPSLMASDNYPVEIQASSTGGERYEALFTAFIPDRPVRESDRGYSPVALSADGGAITTKYLTPLVLKWDFGDGQLVTIRERVSVSHQYADDGDYTVSLVVSDELGEFARATHDITIVNNDPTDLRVAATVIDPARQLVEFTAWARDVAGDSMRFHWDFGDGDDAEGSAEDIWWTRHQYLAPGTYEVTLTVSDDTASAPGLSARRDGRSTKTIDVVVGYGNDASQAGAAELSDDRDEVPLTHRMTGTTRGVVQSDFDGEIRPFAGLFLSKVNSGACRLMFTFRDNSQLMHGFAVLDLFGVPPEGGRFRLNDPQFYIEFLADADTYRKKLRQGPAGIGFGETGIAGLVQRTLDGVSTPGDGSLDDEQRQTITDTLKDRTGIRSQSLPQRDASAIPARSPYVDDTLAFSSVSGVVELDFIPGNRAVGQFDVTLEIRSGPMKGQRIQAQADLAMDMEVAAHDGIVSNEGCEPPPFEIEKIWPHSGFKHLSHKQTPARVNFSDSVDPATLSDDTIQIAYTDTQGTLVPVPIRILRGFDQVHVVPEQPLLTGVRYALRVRTGSEGIRSRKGAPLDSGGEDNWFTSQFTTRVDMKPLSNEQRLLACHVYQPTRDVPLITGKPAVARVFASWEAQPGVHPDHQVQEFTGSVELYGDGNSKLISKPFTFVRPDLWQQRGISTKSAEQTAQLEFTPGENTATSLRAFIKVSTSPEWEPSIQYRTACPVKLWNRQPTLSIDFVALPIDEWRADPSRLQAQMPALQRVADASVQYALQQFPFAEIQAGRVRVLPLSTALPPRQPEHTAPPFACTGTCILNGYPSALAAYLAQFGVPRFEGIGAWLASQSDADMIVAFGPHMRLMGGVTGDKLRNGRGVILVLGGDDAGFFPRYVNGVVHELGHALDLQHLPYVDAATRAIVVPLRDGTPPFWYEGIEALRIGDDGRTVWNKSSSDGNQQSNRLFPLMFPGSTPADSAFIANHHYRQIQKLLEELDR